MLENLCREFCVVTRAAAGAGKTLVIDLGQQSVQTMAEQAWRGGPGKGISTVHRQYIKPNSAPDSAEAAANYVAGVPLVLADEDVIPGSSAQQTDGSWEYLPG